MPRIPDETAELVLEAVLGLEHFFVELTIDLASIESPSDHPHLQRAVFDRLAGALEDAGYRSTHFRGNTSGGLLLGVPRKRTRGAPYQVLLGHADTVWPTGTVARRPVLRDGDVLHGPGTFDMKAGLAMTATALLALERLGVQPTVTPVLHVNSDEEVDSADSSRSILRLCRRADRVLIPEPALGPSGLLKSARPGTALYRFIVRGRASHAGLAPEEGRSAILEMARLVRELHGLNDPRSGVLVNVGTVSGGVRRNIVPDECHFSVDVRTRTVSDAMHLDRVIRSMQPSRDGLSIHVDGEIERPPYDGSTAQNRRLLETALHTARRLGLQIEHGFAGGASDGNFSAQVAPTLDGLGAVGDGAHAENEHVRVGSSLERTALLTLLLLNPPFRVG